MRVLVVNAYPNTPKGKAGFLNFYEIIKQVSLFHLHSFSKILFKCFGKQDVFFDGSFEILVKTNDELDDILYDEVFSYTNKQAAKTFDNLDMIFIEGDVNVLPWDPSLSKVIILP